MQLLSTPAELRYWSASNGTETIISFLETVSSSMAVENILKDCSDWS